MCVCLFLYFTAQSNVTDSVLEVVACEARRLFRDRLVSLKDIHTFDNILSSIIRGDWGSDALDNMTGFRQFYSHWYTPSYESGVHIQTAALDSDRFRSLSKAREASAFLTLNVHACSAVVALTRGMPLRWSSHEHHRHLASARWRNPSLFFFKQTNIESQYKENRLNSQVQWSRTGPGSWINTAVHPKSKQS